MATAQSIINGALRLLQVASDDVVLTASEGADALEALNQLVDTWSTESLMVYHITREQLTLTPAHNPHTIGTGGDLNTARPMAIESATVTVGGVDYPVMPIEYDDYAVIKLKTLQNVYPQYLYLDKTYPTGNLYLYPVPSTASTLNLYSRKPLTQFSSLAAAVTLPPGYERALKFNLAVDLAPEYQVSAGDDVKTLATSSKAALKRLNHRPITLQVDPALLKSGGGRFNIYKGE